MLKTVTLLKFDGWTVEVKVRTTPGGFQVQRTYKDPETARKTWETTENYEGREADEIRRQLKELFP